MIFEVLIAMAGSMKYCCFLWTLLGFMIVCLCYFLCYFYHQSTDHLHIRSLLFWKKINIAYLPPWTDRRYNTSSKIHFEDQSYVSHPFS